jgi:branched-chain amino acid transport system ATP-binding protein
MTTASSKPTLVTDVSIQAENITAAYYEDIEIIRNVSIQADKGRIVSVIGPNGAGKSTLLKTIYGFLRPKKGRILLNGEDITNVPPHVLPAKGVGFIPQRHSVFPDLTVEENLKLGAWTLSKDKNVVDKRISDIYEQFPLFKQRISQSAGKLSGGERRQLELARTMMISPKTLLIDEPTAGLSPKVAKLIYRMLSDLRERGIGILLVDQNVKGALDVSDFIYVLKMGEISASGPIDQFKGELSALIKDWLF